MSATVPAGRAAGRPTTPRERLMQKPEPALPSAQLSRIVQAAVGARPVLGAQPLGGGWSRDSFLVGVAAPAERLVVQLGGRPDATAVEAALLDRLVGRVPVAPLVWADAEGTMAGRPALVTRFVEGVLLDRLLETAEVGTATEAGAAVGRALAAIGAVRFERPGFLDAALEPAPMPGTTGAGLPSELLAFVGPRLLGGQAGRALGADVARAWYASIERAAPALDDVSGAPALVHADFNAKNLLLARREGRLEVSAVLDWEFAFAGSPLFDVGNLLRFPDSLPEGFQASFEDALSAAGGASLGEAERRQARLLDLFALVDLLDRGSPGHGVFDAVLALVQARVADDEA